MAFHYLARIATRGNTSSRVHRTNPSQRDKKGLAEGVNTLIADVIYTRLYSVRDYCLVQKYFSITTVHNIMAAAQSKI